MEGHNAQTPSPQDPFRVMQSQTGRRVWGPLQQNPGATPSSCYTPLTHPVGLPHPCSQHPPFLLGAALKNTSLGKENLIWHSARSRKEGGCHRRKEQ